MFYDSAEFGFARTLEENWQEVYHDYLKVRAGLVDWVEKDLYEEGWKVFGLFDFPSGRPVEPNVGKCPFTASLVERQVRSHGAAGFSVLKPMTRIKPHRGYQGDFLRCHLGLVVPEGDCALRVNDEVRNWQVGKVLIFDDRATHEAWNLTDQERVVLLVDFVPAG